VLSKLKRKNKKLLRGTSQKEDSFGRVEKLKGLSSIAINDGGSVFVPGWFLGKGGPGGLFENVYNRVVMGVPEVSRGDFLVHQNHGVGRCVGLALKGGAGEEQDLLIIKYEDGGLVSVDVGRMDFFLSHAPDLERESTITPSVSEEA
jgi:hypothetical protein